MSDTALLNDYDQLGLLSKSNPAAVQNDTKSEIEEQRPPSLIRLIEFPHPYRYGQTQTLPIDLYERQNKDEAAESEYKSHSILVRRVISELGLLKKLQIEIQSQGLRDIFKRVGRPYRDLNVESNPITISRPFHSLFFLREELRKEEENDQVSPRTKKEIRLLLDFIETKECLHDIITKFQNVVPSKRISFDLLWSLFPPNELVFFHDDYVEQCFIVESCNPIVEGMVLAGATFNLIYAKHDGTRFGLRRQNLVLPAFVGIVDIVPENLPIIPLRFLSQEEQEKTRGRLVSRGKAYCELQAAKFTMRHHDGVMWSEKGSFTESKISFGEDKMTIDVSSLPYVSPQVGF